MHGKRLFSYYEAFRLPFCMLAHDGTRVALYTPTHIIFRLSLKYETDFCRYLTIYHPFCSHVKTKISLERCRAYANRAHG